MAAAEGVVIGPGRSAAQVAARRLPVKERSCPRSSTGADQQGLEGDDRLGAVRDGLVTGDLEHADHLGETFGALRCRGRDPGQDRAGGVLGIDLVGLASLTSHAPVGAVDLNDLVSASA